MVSNCTASAPPHDVHVDKCDEDKDKTHEVNSDMKVSDIFEEGLVRYAMHTDAPHHWLVIIELCIYLSHNYNTVISL